MRLRDLAGETLLVWDRHIMPYLFDKVDDLYTSQGLTPTRVPTPDAGPYNQAGLMMVASGKGIYLCMGIPFTANQTVAVVPLSDPEAMLDICVAWRKNETSPTVCKFLESVWQVFPQARPGGTKTVARRAS